MIKQNNDLSTKFMQGAFLLTISSIIIKLLSAAYRVPYQNIVGDVGFYIYQQVYPLYALALVLSTYGFPVIISKLLAEMNEGNRQYTRVEIVVSSWVSLTLISAFAFSALFFGAEIWSGMMNDPMLEKSIKMISLSFLFLPFLSVLKGIFQSDGEMVPTAVAQVVEQTVRVGFILLASWIFYYYGLSLYKVAEWAFAGSVIGSAISVLILVVYYRRKRNRKDIIIDSVKIRQNLLPLSGKILGQGIIFSISSLILVFIQFMDAFVLYPLLTESGMEMINAKQWKGVYDRGQPLLHVGTAATIALSLTIVPLISKYKQQNDRQNVRRYTELSFRLSLMMGMAATVGLALIIKPVNIMLFTDARGSKSLAVLSISILFCSLLMTGMSILQSLGHSLISVGIIAVGLLVKFALMLVLIPKLSIMGAAISTTTAFIVMACLLFGFLRKIFRRPVIKRQTWLLVLFASLGMSAAIIMEDQLFSAANHYLSANRLIIGFQVLFTVCTGAIVYMVTIIRMGMFTLDELTLLPFGSKLAKFLPRK